MFCSNCGAMLEEDALFCPDCGEKIENEAPVMAEGPVVTEAPVPVEEPVPAEEPAPTEEPAPVTKTARKKPHIALRILLQFISFVLCVCLTAGLLAAAVLADVHILTSKGGISKIISALFTSPTSAAPRPIAGAVGGHLSLPDMGEIEIPDEILTGGGDQDSVNALIRFLYETLQERSEEPLPITEEQLQTFVEKSTVTDYLSEKLAGYAEDFINGTENTTITTEEVMGLLEENKALIQSEFGVEITPEMKQQITATVDKMVVEQDISSTIRDQVNTTVEDMLTGGEESPAPGSMNLQQLRSFLQFISSDYLLYAAAACCLALILLLCLANFYNVPAGLTWSAVPAIVLGIILSLPLAAVQLLPQALTAMIPNLALVIQLAGSFAGAIAPIHYGLLGLGVVLLVASIVWRCVRASVRKKAAVA